MFKKLKKWFTGEEELKEEIIEELDEEKENITENIEEIKEEFEELIEEVKETKEEIVEELKEEFLESKEAIIETVEELKEDLTEIKEEVIDKEEELEETVEEKLEEIIDSEEEYEEVEIVEEELEELVEETMEINEEKPKKKGFFQKLVEGLDKTRQDMTSKINSVFSSYHKVDEELFDDLEEILVTADIGINTTMEIIDNLRDRVKENRVTEPEIVKTMLKEEIEKTMVGNITDNKLNINPSPAIILVVGVNGVGKTTTIGKLSNNLKQDGKSVLIAAGDTFRAAAIEQLEEWGNRANVDVISHTEGADPAAVVYDGIQAAKSRKVDVLICDTAGRLHNKKNLMNELNKIFRVVENEYPEATREVLLVLDATTGQNAILQAKTFKEVSDISGIALTKLDGTAKGGVVIALQSELGIPVKLVGVGEGIDDLQEFNSKDFIEAIFQ